MIESMGLKSWISSSSAKAAMVSSSSYCDGGERNAVGEMNALGSVGDAILYVYSASVRRERILARWRFVDGCVRGVVVVVSCF